MQIRTMPVGQMGTNAYLLEDEHTGTAAVIDPGAEGERILAQAKADGVEIRLILLTHAHFDHTGGLSALHRALPDVPVYLHPADRARLGDDIFPALDVPTLPYEDGDVLQLGGLDIQVLHTPGHPPGGVCLMVGDALFTGDTLFQGSMGRVDFGGSYEDIMASLKRLAGLPGDFRVLPGHMGATTLERERRTNYYMQQAREG